MIPSINSIPKQIIPFIAIAGYNASIGDICYIDHYETRTIQGEFRDLAVIKKAPTEKISSVNAETEYNRLVTGLVEILYYSDNYYKNGKTNRWKLYENNATIQTNSICYVGFVDNGYYTVPLDIDLIRSSSSNNGSISTFKSDKCVCSDTPYSNSNEAIRVKTPSGVQFAALAKKDYSSQSGNVLFSGTNTPKVFSVSSNTLEFTGKLFSNYNSNNVNSALIGYNVLSRDTSTSASSDGYNSVSGNTVTVRFPFFENRIPEHSTQSYYTQDTYISSSMQSFGVYGHYGYQADATGRTFGFWGDTDRPYFKDRLIYSNDTRSADIPAGNGTTAGENSFWAPIKTTLIAAIESANNTTYSSYKISANSSYQFEYDYNTVSVEKVPYDHDTNYLDTFSATSVGTSIWYITYTSQLEQILAGYLPNGYEYFDHYTTPTVTVTSRTVTELTNEAAHFRVTDIP